MKGPTLTAQNIEAEKIFQAVKKETGLEGATIFTHGFKEIHKKFSLVYRPGMTLEETLEAMKKVNFHYT